MTKLNHQGKNQFINHHGVPRLCQRWGAVDQNVRNHCSCLLGKQVMYLEKETCNATGVGLSRMVEDWKQRGITGRPRADGGKRQEKRGQELNIQGALWKRPNDIYLLCFIFPVLYSLVFLTPSQTCFVFLVMVMKIHTRRTLQSLTFSWKFIFSVNSWLFVGTHPSMIRILPVNSVPSPPICCALS